jgi:hypothetical protein
MPTVTGVEIRNNHTHRMGARRPINRRPNLVRAEVVITMHPYQRSGLYSGSFYNQAQQLELEVMEHMESVRIFGWFDCGSVTSSAESLS